MDGKVALVTGAGRGIGRAVSLAYAREGAKVAVVSRTASTVEDVVRTIQGQGGTALGVTCDVREAEQILMAVRQTVEAFGTVDILVNNAQQTTGIQARFIDTTDEMILEQMTSGFLSTVRFMRACFPYMKAGGGKVINLGSGAGIIGGANMFAYGAAKEAIRQATRVAAREWGKYGVNVNTVCPAAMTEGLAQSMQADPAAGAFIQAIPLRRAGDLDTDIAPIFVFLASEASNYLTGHTLMADGGSIIDAAR